MERIRDKTLLLLFGLLFLFFEKESLAFIAALLLCICISSFYEYCRNRLVLLGGSLLYMGFLLFHPALIFFFPVFLYDLYFSREWAALAAGGAVYLISLFPLNIFQIFFCSLSAILSLILAHATRNYLQLAYELKRQRDSSRELELILKNKNKDLMEKQDYEIHLATLKERNRIAREIHDNVGHMLSRSILQAAAVRAISREEGLQPQLTQLSDTLNAAMDSIRSSVHDLHDESLDLEDKIQNMLKDYGKYEILFDYDLSPKTPKELKYCFLTVIKEALSNVVKHSDGDKIHIILREFQGFYQLQFQDNGNSFEEKVMTGIGLDNMRERVEAFSGTLNLQTEQGFKIFITIPKVNL